MIYLDSCIVTYAVEPRLPWTALTETTMARAGVGATFAISALVKAECLVGPLKQHDEDVAESYIDYFSRLLTLDMPEPVYFEAASIRARYGLKLVDALHLACARFHGCTALWTNDARLSAAGGDLIRVLGP